MSPAKTATSFTSCARWLTCIVFLSLSACGQFKIISSFANGQKTKVLTEDEADANSVEAENLVDEAEVILKPVTLDEAERKLAEALVLDPNNARARFWQASLKPVNEFRGILTRIKPIYNALPNGLLRYALMTDKVLQRNPPGSRHFLMDGPPDFKTIDDFQEWADRVIIRLSEFRAFLKANKENEIRIQPPSDFFSSAENTSDGGSKAIKCEATKFGPLHIDLGYCDNRKDILLNRADFEALQQMVAAFQGYFIVLNAYRVNPELILKASEAKTDEERRFDSDDLHLLLAAGFGRLRAKNQFSMFTDILQEAKIGVLYYLQNQSEVCPLGYMSSDSRPGHFMQVGLCRQSTPTGGNALERTASVLETILTGRPITPEMFGPAMVKSSNWSVLPLRFIEHPVSDLSFIQSTTLTPCGTLVKIDDNALAPYFASGSATAAVQSSLEKCRASQAAADTPPGPDASEGKSP